MTHDSSHSIRGWGGGLNQPVLLPQCQSEHPLLRFAEKFWRLDVILSPSKQHRKRSTSRGCPASLETRLTRHSLTVMCLHCDRLGPCCNWTGSNRDSELRACLMIRVTAPPREARPREGRRVSHKNIIAYHIYAKRFQGVTWGLLGRGIAFAW